MGEHDEVLGKAIEALRELPDVRPEATARLLIAVAAERQRTREASLTHATRMPGRRSWAALAAVAAVVAGIALLPAALRTRTTAPDAVASDAARAVHAIPASNDAAVDGQLRPVQLVFSAPQARNVRVVGDFNGWDDRRSPMVRDEVSGLWNVSLSLRPGRHVYAFVVNDTQWVRDPRATAAPDADFGRPGSVLLVGRP